MKKVSIRATMRPKRLTFITYDNSSTLLSNWVMSEGRPTFYQRLHNFIGSIPNHHQRRRRSQRSHHHILKSLRGNLSTLNTRRQQIHWLRAKKSSAPSISSTAESIFYLPSRLASGRFHFISLLRTKRRIVGFAKEHRRNFRNFAAEPSEVYSYTDCCLRLLHRKHSIAAAEEMIHFEEPDMANWEGYLVRVLLRAPRRASWGFFRFLAPASNTRLFIVSIIPINLCIFSSEKTNKQFRPNVKASRQAPFKAFAKHFITAPKSFKSSSKRPSQSCAERAPAHPDFYSEATVIAGPPAAVFHLSQTYRRFSLYHFDLQLNKQLPFVQLKLHLSRICIILLTFIIHAWLNLYLSTVHKLF